MNARVVLAILLLLLALQRILWSWIAPYVCFLFLPTVFFGTRLGSFWAGLNSTVLSIGIVLYFFIPTPSSLYSADLFLIMSYLFGVAYEHLRRVQWNAEALVANKEITQNYQQTLELISTERWSALYKIG